MGGRGYGGGGRGRVYTYRYTVTTRMTCIKMGSNESHFNVSLVLRDKVTRLCPQTTIFLKRKESRSGIEPRSFRLPAYRLTARPNRMTRWGRAWRQALIVFAVGAFPCWTYWLPWRTSAEHSLWRSPGLLCNCTLRFPRGWEDFACDGYDICL